MKLLTSGTPKSGKKVQLLPQRSVRSWVWSPICKAAYKQGLSEPVNLA